MPDQKRIEFQVQASSKQVIIVPKDTVGSPSITIYDVRVELENGKPEFVTLCINLSVSALRDMTRASTGELRSLQESATI